MDNNPTARLTTRDLADQITHHEQEAAKTDCLDCKAHHEDVLGSLRAAYRQRMDQRHRA